MWQRGPLPPGTVGWGGVVLFSQHGGQEDAFYFAEFQGSTVQVIPTGQVLMGEDVALYNLMELPSGVIRRGE